MPHIVVTHSSVNKLLLSLLLYLIPKCSLWNVSVLTLFPFCIFVLSDVMHSQDSGVICVQQLLIPTLLDLRLSLAHFLPSLLKCQASKIVLNSFIFCPILILLLFFYCSSIMSLWLLKTAVWQVPQLPHLFYQYTL